MTIPSHIPQIECDELGEDVPDRNERIANFVARELAPLVPNDARIVTFDGFDGAGKSPLSRHLADVTGVPLVGLDDFLTKDQCRFLGALRFDEISNAIDGALEGRGRVIVEGCLLEAALETIGRQPELRVYVMRTTPYRIDRYDVLYGDEPTADLIARLEREAKVWAEKMPEKFGGGGSGELSNLERELIHYHRDHRPHDRANLISKIVRRS